MSDKTDQSPPSSSVSSPSDQSLERLLGAIARGLDGLVQGNLELRRAFADLDKHVRQSDRRSESRISDLQIAIDTFVSRVEAVIDSQKTVVGTTVDARRALEDSRRSFDRAVEETGKRLLYDPAAEEGEAPRAVRVLAVKIVNFAWPVAMRRGPQALVWGIKLTGGVASLAGLAKLIHDYWASIHF